MNVECNISFALDLLSNCTCDRLTNLAPLSLTTRSQSQSEVAGTHFPALGAGWMLLGSLSMRVFETRTAAGKEHFGSQDSDVSQIFIVIISNQEKILSNVDVVV